MKAENKVIFESISSIETENGFVKISLTNQSVNYCNALKKFTKKTEILYKEITRASKRLQAQRVDEVNQLY